MGNDSDPDASNEEPAMGHGDRTETSAGGELLEDLLELGVLRKADVDDNTLKKTLSEDSQLEKRSLQHVVSAGEKSDKLNNTVPRKVLDSENLIFQKKEGVERLGKEDEEANNDHVNPEVNANANANATVENDTTANHPTSYLDSLKRDATDGAFFYRDIQLVPVPDQVPGQVPPSRGRLNRPSQAPGAVSVRPGGAAVQRTRSSFEDDSMEFSAAMEVSHAAAPPLPDAPIAITSARLVTNEDDSDYLRDQLRQLQNAPTAVVVPESPFDEDEDRAAENSSPSIWAKIRLPVALALALLVLTIVVLATTGTFSSSSKEEPIVTSTIDTVDVNATVAPTVELIPPGPVLQKIKERGYIQCRVNPYELEEGEGISLDLCAAFSAALFDGDTNRTEYTWVPFSHHFQAIDNYTVDLTLAQVTFNMGRDIFEKISHAGLSFQVPWFYSGTIFGGPADLVDCATRGDTLNGVCRRLAVCVIQSTTTYDVVQAHLDGSGVYLISPQESLFEEFAIGNCNVIAGDPPLIYEERIREYNYTGEYVVGTAFVSQEPMATATRDDDPVWADFANSLFLALFAAENENITKATASQFPQTTLFGEEYKDMYRHAIATVGNWDELYHKTFSNFVKRSGPNLLYKPGTNNTGGLLIAPPMTSLDFTPESKFDTLPGLADDGGMINVTTKGVVRCGIVPNRPGFAQQEFLLSNDTATTVASWTGMDVAMCRCLAVALTGLADRLEIVELQDAASGFMALNQGLVDVFAGAPYSLAADIQEPTTGRGYSFSPIYFYDIEEGLRLGLATNENAYQWTDFVRWVVYSLIHAERENISKANAALMPTVDLFGPDNVQMFRLMVDAFGNYGDIYEANLEQWIPRRAPNVLNDRKTPLTYPLPVEQFAGKA